LIKDFHSVYFIGIGGIGMSALARWFNTNGYAVAGYDKTPSDLTKELENEGINIHYEDNADLIEENFKVKDCLVVYTPAIPADHSELNFYRNNGFDLKKRSQVLGMLTQSYFTVAVAGTHGKTTTSSMVAHVLKEAGKNIFAFIGGITRNYKTNLLLGDDKAGEQIMVVEADEYDRSFLTLQPSVAVVTTMDADHLDIYGSGEAVTESFNLFADKLVKDGILINRTGLPVSAEGRKQLSFGESGADFSAENIKVQNNFFSFDITGKASVSGIKMQVPGKHNIMNALAAFAVGFELGVNTDVLKNALESFQGVKRRFEYIVNNEKIIYIDDYAHHPTEIEACLSAAKTLYPDKKVTAVFQPHLFSRTRDFMKEFGSSLSIADAVILLPVYPARELPIPGITSEAVLEGVSAKEKEVCSKENLLKRIEAIDTDVLLTIGAGDIDRFIDPIRNMFS
jgi:UDP-N-acetylmuramate--alanine ligase